MPEGVKATRRYDSTRRREQAAATRLEILEAAQRLFERDGYVATTMAAVAAEAGVALKTVYLAFETKAGLLRALWHLRLRGDEADVPIAERQWYRDVIAEPDPERQLRLGAHNARLVKERAAKLMRVMRDAAGTDADSAALWRRIQDDFLRQPAGGRRHHRGQGGPRSRARRRARRRHPLDAEPPRRLAPAGRRARLDAGGVGAVVRRHGVRPAARALSLSRRAPAAAPAA